MVSHKKFRVKNSKSRMHVANSRLVLLLAIFLVLYFFYKNISSSVFLHKSDRLNVVFYDKTPVYYSLGFGDIDYLLPMSSNTQVLVPGGYGLYRVGAMEKLVSLEKKPNLIQKTFAAATSSFVDLYFYPQHTMIYYEDSSGNNQLPSWKEILLYKSNANILDRILLWWYFTQKNINQYKIINDLPVKTIGQDSLFDRDEFFKTHQGFFYRQTYRNEKLHVQILYTKSYKTAELIGNLLDGEGIQTVDITQTDAVFQKCSLTYGKDLYGTSNTIKALQSYFGCTVQKGNVDVSDIIFTLGSLEKDWLID